MKLLHTLPMTVRRPLKGAFGRQAWIWSLLRAPRVRLRVFDDPIDCLAYGYSVSRDVVRLIQIGSNDALRGDPLHCFIGMPHWESVLVEPVPYVFRRLEVAYGGQARVHLENAAVADQHGVKDFYYLAETTDDISPWYDQLGSFREEILRQAASWIPELEKRMRVMSVPCVTVGELVRKHGVEPLGFLHIDVEGYDLEILRSVDWDEVTPDVVVFEHKHLDEAEKDTSEALMRSAGYETLRFGFDVAAVSSAALRRYAPLRRAWTAIGPRALRGPSA